MNSDKYFDVMRDIYSDVVSTIAGIAYNMGLLNNGSVSSFPELKVPDNILNNVPGCHTGCILVCEGMRAIDNNTELSHSLSDIGDYVFQHTGKESGSEENEEFITHTDALFVITADHITEMIQQLSPNDETIVEDNRDVIRHNAMTIMFRLGAAIRLQAL